MKELVERMLGLVDDSAWSIGGDDDHFNVAIAGTDVAFDIAAPAIGIAYEQLATAVESAISGERVRLMLDAASVDAELPPLWIVTGSDVLSHWLGWARTSNALRKALTLTDDVGLAPVAGYLDRRARRELGQGGARIRVQGGIATAERVELSDQPRCIAILGERSRICVEGHKLPDTLVAALQQDGRRNELRPLAEIISHPFFTMADLRITGVSNDGAASVFEVASRWMPLEPVPAAALSVLPNDVDPIFPWRATASERRRLNGLVEEARHRFAATHDPH